MRIVDPPPSIVVVCGWAYIFPKAVPDGERVEFNSNPSAWLEKNGYPVDKYPYYILRSWYQDDTRSD